MEQKRLPLGIEDFKTVAQECYYVDKTDFIEEIVDYPSGTVCLYTRPRRFGKSLALSMIDYFFNKRYESRPLFKNKIIGSSSIMAKINSMEVIRLNFKNTNAGSYEDLLSKISDLMALSFASFAPFEGLSSADEDFCQRAINHKLNESDLSISLFTLIRLVKSSSSLPCLVLIDEYDAPIQNAFEGKYYDKAILFFKDFYGSALKGNLYLDKAVMTGVAQIAQASIFSGLNSLVTNSIVSNYEKEYFGFSEKEVEDILAYYDVDTPLQDVKDWYDGYLFQGIQVYNPWSIISFIKNRGTLDYYWVNTGSYGPIKEAISTSLNSRVKDILLTLLGGGTVESFLRPTTNYLDLQDPISILSLLVFSGYLRAEKTSVPSRYSLSLPNKEVAETFRKEIIERYISEDDFSGNLLDLKNALLKMDEKEIGECLEKFLINVFSYYDLSDEKNYQIMVLTLAAVLFDDHYVKSEFISGKGRCDLAIVPKKKRSSGIVLEIKNIKTKAAKERIEKTAESALKQIEDREYVAILKEAGAKPIFAYGLAFNGKRVAVKGECIAKSNL